MKRTIIFLFTCLLFAACSKSGSTLPDPVKPVEPKDPKGGVTTGNTTNYNGYIVKTIGISRIRVSLDDNNKITVGELFGGGNRIILKAGNSNQMDMPWIIAAFPARDDSGHQPDADIASLHDVIDNGKFPDTTGIGSTVIRLKGFDKAKTGYNQINLVMYDEPFVKEVGYNADYYNLVYLKLNQAAGTKNSDYGKAFIQKVFTGTINASVVEMAKPLAQKPYLTYDGIISFGQASFYNATNKTLGVDFRSRNMAFLTTDDINNKINIGSSYKIELVNGNNGTVSKLDNYTFKADFPNIKTGDIDQIVEPADSTSKVFIRITGLNPALCGYNQLRLFLAKDRLYDGSLKLGFYEKPATVPNLAFIKTAFETNNLYPAYLRLWVP